jgi:tetraacyldisaccharide 4'-kinase
VSVGNIFSGGSGKSPVVREILEHVASLQKAVGVVSRGYRGQADPLGERVDLAQPAAFKKFGDEPCMLADQTGLPVFVGAKKALVLRQLEKIANVSVAILDDGFQNLDVISDRKFVLINADRRPSELNCFPLGTLRESISAVREASAVLLVTKVEGQSTDIWKRVIQEISPSTPVFVAIRRVEDIFWYPRATLAKVEADLQKHSPGSKIPVFIVSGIAHPERFLEDAESEQTIQVAGKHFFPDHHVLRSHDFEMLTLELQNRGAMGILTTEKDYQRLKDFNWPCPIACLRIRYNMPREFLDYCMPLP